MFSLQWLVAALTFSVLASADATDKKYSRSISLSYEVLGQKTSSKGSLATIQYDPTSLYYSLTSWTPPSLDGLKSTTPEATSSPLVRIILPNGSASVASLSTFDKSLSQFINLWVSQDGEGEIFAASITSVNPPPLSEEEARQKAKEERLRARGKDIPEKPKKKKPSSKKEKAKTEDEAVGGPVVKVRLTKSGNGPFPQLNTRKPPQIDAEGREVVTEDQPEKTLFQKYWYVLLIAAFLVMNTGGSEK